jgi:hypothetical protein
MYVLNPEIALEKRIYWVNGIIAEWLIETKKIPILCKKDRLFGFAKTEELNRAILDMPFWLKLSKIF